MSNTKLLTKVYRDRLTNDIMGGYYFKKNVLYNGIGLELESSEHRQINETFQLVEFDHFNMSLFGSWMTNMYDSALELHKETTRFNQDQKEQIDVFKREWMKLTEFILHNF